MNSYKIPHEQIVTDGIKITVAILLILSVIFMLRVRLLLNTEVGF